MSLFYIEIYVNTDLVNEQLSVSGGNMVVPPISSSSPLFNISQYNDETLPKNQGIVKTISFYCKWLYLRNYFSIVYWNDLLWIERWGLLDGKIFCC